MPCFSQKFSDFNWEILVNFESHGKYLRWNGDQALFCQLRSIGNRRLYRLMVE